MSDYESDDDWKPPSEAEMKVLAAKRERNDKISKRMGDYLLKGYKMLATNCPQCYTIELQDKQGQLYCVACQEIDCHETSKDDPVLNAEAADKVLAESAFVSQTRTESDQPPTITAVPQLQRIEEPSRNSVGQFESAAEAGGPLREQTPIEAAVVTPSFNCLQTAGPTSQPSPPPPTTSSTLRHQQSAALPSPVHSILSAQVSSQFEPARLALLSKLDWATRRLEEETRPDLATSLVVLIREIVTTLNTFSS